MIVIKDVAEYLNEKIDFSNQCSWDNCGFLVGNPDEEVKKIGFALDITLKVLEKAVQNGVNLIITHHPVIFYPQKSFKAGNNAYECAVRGVSVISCHTCFDAFKGGVSDTLAEKIGLKDVTQIETEEKPSCLRIGETEEISPDEFAEKVSSRLNTVVRLVNGRKNIKSVAVCGGGGGDFLSDAIRSGADAYVTGDLSHHHFLMAENEGITLIGAGHYETENIAMSNLKSMVEEKFNSTECIDLEMKNPVKYIGCKE